MNIYAKRYRELRELGTGDTGTVCLVKDEKTGFERALKILHTSLEEAKPRELEGFQKEFEVLKNLNHPSIAKVFDAGTITETNNLYIVTEYIQGQDLFDFGEGKSIEVIEDLFVQALRALNYIHSKKVIHLDIKPQNFIVTQQGVLKLIDFGYANFYKRKFKKSTEGNLLTVGTTPYLSPEIIKAEFPPDLRADLYSLGCTFYKVLTREVPFKSADVGEIYFKHLNEVPRPPSELNPSVPDYLDKIILSLLEKNPDNRYPSAQAVIQDLNIRAVKSYPIETQDTQSSYVLEKGKLIARKREWEHFKEVYVDRIYLEECRKKPYLIITGKSGTGKTRFLQECKNEVQSHFAHTMSWKEFKDYKNVEDVPVPSLVLADDASFDVYDLEYLECLYSEIPILIIFATLKEETPGDPECIIHLENFDQEQTLAYLCAATDLPEIPEPIVKMVYSHTHGNPLYLTEYVRVLFEKGFFRDSHGGWNYQLLEDLGSELETVGATAFIKKRLKAKLETLSFQECHLLVLNTMALTGKPTFEDLSEFTGGHLIEESLKFLVDNEILEIDPANHYSFSNPLYKNVLLDKVDPQLKSAICDTAADYYEKSGEHREKVLYYRGRGGSSTSDSCLLELARLQRGQNLYQHVKENLLELIGKGNGALINQAKLELGEIFIETGEFVEAEKYLREIINHQSAISDPLLLAKSIEQLGLSFKRRDNLDAAESYYKQGLALIQQHVHLKWLEVVFKNRLGQIELDRGHIDQTENIFLETWDLWKNRLSDEEKFLAIRSEIDSFYYLKGQFDKAIFYMVEFLKVLEKHPSSENYPIALYKLGIAYAQIGQISEAKKLLNQCHDILKGRKTVFWLYKVYNELAKLDEQNGDLPSSLENFQHAFKLAQRRHMTTDLIFIACNIATVYFKMGQANEAEKYYNFVIKSGQEKPTDEYRTNFIIYISLLGLASVHRLKHSFDQAEICIQKTEELLKKQSHFKFDEQYLWQEKVDLAKAKNDEKELKKSLKKLEELTKQGIKGG